MKKIAIIPARGGSKRIPNKNIKNFLGRPIISYSILAALESNLYDEVMVSTDNEEIAAISLKYGAKVPFMRSSLNSNDFATTYDVLFEVINWYKLNNIDFEIGTCIYACAPFINELLLKQSIDLLLNEDSDCVFPVIQYSHPIQRALNVNESGLITPFYSKKTNSRTQDLKKTFHDSGMFYTFNIERLLLENTLLTNKTHAIQISELHAHDIDNEEDWILAELKYKLQNNEPL